MKLNIGHKITIIYILFVCFILTFVVISFTIDFDLEYDNYYEKEIHFSDEINAINKTNGLGGKFEVIQMDSLYVSLPDSIKNNKDLEYNVLLKRPADEKMDWNTVKHSNNGIIALQWDSLLTGLYKIEVTFNIDTNEYLFRKNIFLNPVR